MRQCEFCMTPLPDNASFCGYCGRTPTYSTEAPTSVSQQPTAPLQESDTEALTALQESDQEVLPQESEEEKQRRGAMIGLGLSLLGDGLAQGPARGLPMVQGTPQVSEVPFVQGSPQTPSMPAGWHPARQAPQSVPSSPQTQSTPPGWHRPTQSKFPLAQSVSHPRHTAGFSHQSPHHLQNTSRRGTSKPRPGLHNYMRVALVAFGAAVLIGVGSIGVGLAAFRPALSLSGSTNVAWGQSISLYGSHFIPGGIVVLTLDGTQPLYYADREPAIQVSSNTHANATAGLAMLVPQISQIDASKDTLVVSANGTFNVTIDVSSNWPVGHHTIRATEKLSQRSAVLNFSVQQLGQAPTSAPTLSPTDTPTLSPTDPPSLTTPTPVGTSSPTAVSSPTDPPSLTHTPTPVRRPSPTAIPSPTDPPSPTASVAGLSCVTPTAITLTADQGSNQPGSEKVTLCASGSGLLNWTASWDQNQAPWLQLDHSSGQIQAPGQGQVTISAKANGLKLGKYTTTVTFSSQPGTSTVSLAATFTVQASTAVTPTTTADPSPSPTPTPTAAPSPSPTTTPTVTISKPGTDLFFPSSTSDNAFTATPGATPAFSQTFPVINFNPPSGTVSCSNTTNVDVNTRPFTDVVPQSDGSCQTIVAQGNGEQAGVGNLEAFDAVFTATITVSQASQVTFNFYSDDGWILSMGTAQDNKNAQPTYVSGPMNNPPSKGPFTGYSVVGSYNNTSAPAQNNLVVNFPAAGTYPFELDYFETELGQLALTLTANGQPIQLVVPTPTPTSAAVTPSPTAVRIP